MPLKKREKVEYISDADIIQLYLKRDERAIRTTDDKYGRFLFRVAFNILHNRLDCEECVNDTYLDIWNAIPPAMPANFPAFISKIIRCIAINRFKEKQRKKRIPSEIIDFFDDIEGVATSNNVVEKEHEAIETEIIINQFIKQLPERQKYIFIERYYFYESCKIISNDLNISLATVYREIDIIKNNLMLYLKENGVII